MILFNMYVCHGSLFHIGKITPACKLTSTMTLHDTTNSYILPILFVRSSLWWTEYRETYCLGKRHKFTSRMQHSRSVILSPCTCLTPRPSFHRYSATPVKDARIKHEENSTSANAIIEFDELRISSKHSPSPQNHICSLALAMAGLHCQHLLQDHRPS